ncbi:MAG: protein phosphatase 2C domain-containing protein [Mariniblastus sp.]|nr:protein phosphatase 2C domain-containing protein [Mariniblastus sp.]
MLLPWKKNRDCKDESETKLMEDLDYSNFQPPNIECAGLSHKGQKRKINEDQFLIADLHKNMHIQSSSTSFSNDQLFGNRLGKLLFVADGVGGAQAGEIASQIAIQSMAQYLLNSMHWLFNPNQPEIERFIEDLKTGAMQSHELVRTNAKHDPKHRGMGTTLTVAYLIWPMLYVLHIGDSRCYILREAGLQLLTKDQTLAQHLHDCGHLKRDELDQSPYHNILLSAIGSQNGPNAVVYKTQLHTGDRIMLCSDGVNKHLEDDDIEAILLSDRTADEICQDMVDVANNRGGTDNITVVVAKTFD